MSQNSNNIVLQELQRFFDPILQTQGDPQSVLDFFDAVGWKLTNLLSAGEQQNVVQAINSIITELGNITTLAANPPSDLEALALALAQNVVPVITNINNLAQAFPSLASVPFADLPVDVLQYLTLSYLQSTSPTLSMTLELLGIINKEPEEQDSLNGLVYRIKHKWPDMQLSHLTKLLTDPVQVIVGKYWPNGFNDGGQGAISLGTALWNLAVTAGLLDGLSTVLPGDADPSTVLQFTPDGQTTLLKQFSLDDYSTGVLGVRLSYIDPTSGGPGAALTPYGKLDISQNAGPFLIKLTGTLESNPISITASGVSQIDPSKGRFTAQFSVSQGDDGSWAFLFGDLQGTYFGLNGYEFYLGLNLNNGSLDIALGIALKSLSINLSVGEGDGFLNSLIPSPGLKNQISPTLEWSNRTGLSLKGGGALKVVIPSHVHFGPIDIDSLTIAAKPAGTSIPLQIVATVGATLGPLAVAIQDVGLQATLAMPDSGGSLGPFDISLGFQAPSGLGISIDAAVVSGGGFVSFNQDKGEYAGFLDIGIAEIIQVTFICILDTKLPNGAPGFSLLFIIFMELPPIQLGFGFTLNGVGGVAGVNRTMSITGLQAGLRNHTLDYVINPPHTVADAPKVISAVNSFFPIATGRYVFGPILKVGWETFVQLTVGVILEVPDPIRLAILGIFDIALPTIEEPDEAIVKIHIDVLGTLDFGTKKLTVDGSMYDSSILEFPMLGDFALRSSWGANPSSLFTIGGFNSKFDTTGLDVPQLHRLSITIGDGDNPRISANAYLAITSNTIQFGANIDAYVSVGDFSVRGYLGFDVLIVISPPSISFEFDFAASLDVAYQGHSLAGLNVTGVFTGTSPWHIHGDATLHILCFSVSASVDSTWGQSITPAPPPEKILPDLLPALQDPNNWSAGLPDGDTQAVTVSAPPPSPQTVLVHPMGTLTVREKIVPLDLPITHYKGGTPSDGNIFTISDVQINGAPATKDYFPDYFAAGQFIDLSDADKLSRPSFESYHAGAKIGSKNLCSGPDSARDVAYDECFIDDPNSCSRHSQLPYLMPADVYIALSRQGAAFTSGARYAGLNKYQNGPATPAVTAGDPSYVVASTDDLSIRRDISPSTGATYFQARAALNKYLVTHPADRGTLEVLPLHEVPA